MTGTVDGTLAEGVIITRGGKGGRNLSLKGYRRARGNNLQEVGVLI